MTQKTAKKQSQYRFKFIPEKVIKSNYIQITNYQMEKLRVTLPKGIYWVQISPRGLRHWNWTLLQDYIFNGDRPEHQQLVEEYLSTRLDMQI
jgi:hypothetical protein